MDIQNSVVLITGGSLGIGKATALELVKKGAKVIITGRNAERLEAAAKEVGAVPFLASADKPDEVQALFDFIAKEFGKLDVVVNNAGIGGEFQRLEDLSMEDFANVYAVNVFGAALTAKFASEMMKKQETGGTIINIGSTAGSKGFERGTVYASSKFALRGMTQCWQAELRKFNIRVIYLAPSEVATAFGSQDRVERDAAAHKLHSEDIAHAIVSVVEMNDRGFVPELSVWATNPWREQ